MSSQQQHQSNEEDSWHEARQRHEPSQLQPQPQHPVTNEWPVVEMAYLLLDDCYSGFRLQQSSSLPSSSSLCGVSNNNNTTTEIPPTFHQWMPLRVIPPKAVVGSNDVVSSPSPPPDDDRNRNACCCCRRCHLIVTQNNSNNDFCIDLNHVVPYDGTIQDIRCSSNTDDEYDGSGGDNNHSTPGGIRHDAAVLMGLVAACHPHVQIVQCEILLLSPPQQQQHSSAVPQPRHPPIHPDTDSYYYGSLSITLSFPKFTMSTAIDVADHSRVDSRRSILATTTTQHRTTKPLYPGLQLLLTLIRSDWDQFERRKEQLLLLSLSHKNSKTQKPLVSFFPSSLTLSSMYQRIQPQQGFSTTGRNRGGALSDAVSCDLMSLPLDILKRRIVQPYFDASSLASLRSTCQYMYDSLRSIVPGLTLQLYNHQVNSLQWMRRRETSLIRTESDCFDAALNTGAMHCETGDIHRAITGGASVKLCTNPLPVSLLSHTERPLEGTTYVDPFTGLEILPNEIRQRQDLRRHVACGGLLCDDPGLGKTITVLALILQTPSQTHRPNTSNPQADESRVNKSSHRSSDDEKLFEMYWSEEISPEFRAQYLLKLINDLCKKIPLAVGRFFPIGDFRKSIENDRYGASFAEFDVAVQNAIRNCQTPEHPNASTYLIPAWQVMVQDLKRLQMNSVRKCFANAKAKPNSRIAALVEEGSRKKHVDSLLPSTGTLIVVPSVLLEHWKTQINQHVGFCYLTDKIPLIFEFQRRDAGMSYDRATILCRMNQTHAPMVFIDNGGTRPLPPAEFLAMFQIVITTTQRFVNEAKKGSFKEELERGNNIDNSSSICFDSDDGTACELLKVHWMRMIVDEGHSMGNDEHNSSIAFASWIKAYRRWAMTGTPTKQSATQLRQVRGLMSFLQHEFFNSRLNGDVLWKSRIVKGWKDGNMASFFRIYNLLRFFMRRHTKLSIEELPPPVFIKSIVETSCLEANTYNTLVSAVQMNLLLTSMNGKTSGFQDSLLHRSQAKNARLVLQNIRRVCTGWSRVVPTLSFRYYAETLEMAKLFKHSDDAIAKIKLFMTRAENEELSTCSCCGIQISTLLLMSCCGGQICTECMDSTTIACYICENQFDVDELQKFQPGFILDWRSNLELARSSKVLLNTETPSIPAIEPLIRPLQARHRTKKPGDGHRCEYDLYASDGRCINCLEEHNFCCLLNDRWRCTVCYRSAEECPMEESKSYFLSRRLLELHEQHSRNHFRSDNATYFLKTTRPLKVIVFSQFRAALNFIGDRLLRKFGTACVAEFFGSHRKQELHKFTHEECCFCLLLTKDGSEGLDLSFVTNVIFLEEVFDKSLVDQVVARAWRMGANGRVTIETLIAKNTIEELIGEQKSSLSVGFEKDVPSRTGDQQRLKSLLQSLRFIVDHQSPFRNNSLSMQHDLENTASGNDRNSLKRPLTNAKSGESLCQPLKQKSHAVRFADID